MTALVETKRLSLYHQDHAALAARLAARGEVVDLLVVDTPYSERTHTGHDGTLPGDRSPIPYAFWTPADVEDFVARWRPLNRGWMVSITDHVLWPAWEAAAKSAGLYTFPPVPAVVRGRSVRLRGDGPSSWTYWMLMARPPALVTWGTCPGSHDGPRERMWMTGAKPLWLLEELVSTYSRPGQVVCDPVCGTGTALVAALRKGRDALGGDGALSAMIRTEARCEAALRAGKGITTRRRVRRPESTVHPGGHGGA